MVSGLKTGKQDGVRDGFGEEGGLLGGGGIRDLKAAWWSVLHRRTKEKDCK